MKGVGDLLFLVPANDARSIVLKHGTGNLAMFNGLDVTLDTDDHWALLIRVGTRWLVMTNVAAGAASDHGGLSGLADDDHTQYARTDGTRAITGVQELLGINLTDATELTIASGAITATQSQHSVDTEADASSDDLDTITMTAGAGSLLFIAPAHTDRTVVLKHGTGNIATFDGADVSLNTSAHWAMLMRFGATWLVLANSAGGGGSDHGGLTGLGDDDHTQYVLANGTRPITGMQELLGLNLTDAAELTIASGAVTATQSLHLIDTEADASSDDLATITAATGAGDLVVIFPMHTDRTVVLKHGTGNLVMASAADITLDSTAKGAMLWRVGASWFVFANVVPASFDPASPGAIGGTTPAAVTATVLHADPSGSAGSYTVPTIRSGAYQTGFAHQSDWGLMVTDAMAKRDAAVAAAAEAERRLVQANAGVEATRGALGNATAGSGAQRFAAGQRAASTREQAELIRLEQRQAEERRQEEERQARERDRMAREQQAAELQRQRDALEAQQRAAAPGFADRAQNVEAAGLVGTARLIQSGAAGLANGAGLSEVESALFAAAQMIEGAPENQARLIQAALAPYISALNSYKTKLDQIEAQLRNNPNR